MVSPKGLTIAEVMGLLRPLQGLHSEIVLVGGQAIAYWAEKYREHWPHEFWAVNSSDIDFCGDSDAVVECARRLNGTPRLAPPFDATPNTGMVEFELDGKRILIDFLRAPFGLDEHEVDKWAISVTDPDAVDPHESMLRVMHPVHCLESRVHNVAGLNRADPLAMRQLEASIIVAREYLRERLGANAKGPSAVSKLNERIFKFAYFNLNARKLFREYQIDPFDAVLADAELLTADFRAIRYPQMVANLARQRKAH